MPISPEPVGSQQQLWSEHPRFGQKGSEIVSLGSSPASRDLPKGPACARSRPRDVLPYPRVDIVQGECDKIAPVFFYGWPYLPSCHLLSERL